MRAELDRQMQAVLTDLARCSHVPASGYEPRSRASDDSPGGSRPPGDVGHTKYAREYGPPFHERSPRHPGAATDERREEVLRRARAELQALHGRGFRERPVGESLERRNERMVKDGEGWTVREVAIHFRCGEREVRKAREAAGREPDYGRLPKRDADSQHRRERALELQAKGLTLAQIARLLDVHRSTIERDLGKRAA